jgi:ADP-heptose:LPS heptosyltransferase
MADKKISIVLAVYNKADFLRATLTSLYVQEGSGSDFHLDFVLVDDASSDASLAVADAFFSDHPAAVTIIRNEKNAGPAVRLNQGMQAATGDYVFVFDADDIAPHNVLKTMLAVLESERLDYLYGRSQKTPLSATEAAAIILPEKPDVLISDEPLRFTLEKGIVLPIVLIRRELAQYSGGCDEKVFIQDESLALRLALVAHRAGVLQHPCRYVLLTPEEIRDRRTGQQHLSANIAQQHHDQYLTYTHLLENTTLTPAQRTWLSRKAISPWWKSVRGKGFHPVVFFCYLLGKLFPRGVLAIFRSRLDRYFAQMPNVRRVSGSQSVQRNAEKILVIRHGAFGDIVQADGALRDIRAHHPQAEIVLLTTPPFRRLLERCPHISRLMLDERAPLLKLGKFLALRCAVRAENFSRVYDLQSSHRTKAYRRFLLPNIPWCDNRDFDGRPVRECYKLQLEREGVPAKYSLYPDVSWMADDMSAFLKSEGVRPGYIFLIPGCAAKHPQKRWPYYAELAEKLIALGYEIVTAPGPDEIELSKTIPGHTLLGPKGFLGWFELAGVIKEAIFVIGNDTGPSHVAACLGCSGLILFGSHTQAERTGILRPNFRAIEVGDLKDLSTQKVLEAVLPRLPSL